VCDARILIVEDADAIARGLATALESQGYCVTLAELGEVAVQLCAEKSFELILLDLGLPDLDGIDVCRRVRGLGVQSTLVMLTARTEEADVVAGLDAGADDYVTKPFRLAELQARVRAHLRRQELPVLPAVSAAPIVIGSLVVDPEARRAFVAGIETDLRPKEFDLLALLVSEAGRALTRKSIMDEVWDEHWHGSTKTLDMHISALRRKLGEPPPVTITTLRGVGYRLELM
jgi:DNA-binding response OmpR family regulator